MEQAFGLHSVPVKLDSCCERPQEETKEDKELQMLLQFEWKFDMVQPGIELGMLT